MTTWITDTKLGEDFHSSQIKKLIQRKSQQSYSYGNKVMFGSNKFDHFKRISKNRARLNQSLDFHTNFNQSMMPTNMNYSIDKSLNAMDDPLSDSLE